MNHDENGILPQTGGGQEQKLGAIRSRLMVWQNHADGSHRDVAGANDATASNNSSNAHAMQQ